MQHSPETKHSSLSLATTDSNETIITSQILPTDEETFTLQELTKHIKDQSKLIQELQSKICTCSTHQQTRETPSLARIFRNPCFTVLLVLVLVTLLKCLVSVELVNQRLDGLGAPQLKLNPRPWAPFLWLGHAAIWISKILWAHFSSAIERILAALVTGLAVTALFVLSTRRGEHPPSSKLIDTQPDSLVDDQ